MVKPLPVVLRGRGGSMWPALRFGDYLLLAQEKDFRIGHIIVFRQRNLTIAHRLWRRIPSGGGALFYTKGDAHFRGDPVVRKSRVLGVIVARIRNGKYQKMDSCGRRWSGLLMACIIPVIVGSYQAVKDLCGIPAKTTRRAEQLEGADLSGSSSYYLPARLF
ncbi:MAG TPA: hypothetical protein VGL91_13140 [Acidobacteriota bacterium]